MPYYVVQYVDGNQRIVYVSELADSHNEGDCCVYENCTCNSLDHALANLTSNVLINITTDVALSSLIKVTVDIVNVTVIGNNDPIVICRSFGGLHFRFCHNCTIQGITWDGCGAVENIDNHIYTNEPVIMLNNSSNIIINNCIFQYSKGQAVLLSEVSGDVSINHCNFVHNNCYSGHGAAIHYSSSSVTSCLINKCNFSSNKHAESLVCTKSKNSECKNTITFHNTKFYHNQGVSIYAVNQNLYLSGKNLFWNNTAVNGHGAGLHISDHSTVLFIENSNATFIQNFGGAIYSWEHSNIILYSIIILKHHLMIIKLGMLVVLFTVIYLISHLKQLAK